MRLSLFLLFAARCIGSETMLFIKFQCQSLCKAHRNRCVEEEESSERVCGPVYVRCLTEVVSSRHILYMYVGVDVYSMRVVINSEI